MLAASLLGSEPCNPTGAVIAKLQILVGRTLSLYPPYHGRIVIGLVCKVEVGLSVLVGMTIRAYFILPANPNHQL